MKKQLAATLIIISMPFLFVSCVSTLLKDSPPTFSKEIRMREPGAPFARTQASVYPSWKSTATGNVMAIVSDCSENSYYTLSTLHQLIENPLEKVKVLQEDSAPLQNQPALYRTVTAELDGFPIEVQSVSFKRKSCGYVASLSGKSNHLAGDRAAFESFINGLTFE